MSDPEEEQKGDCYADGERSFMEWGQRLRHHLLLPVLKFLDQQHVTANHLTIVSLVTGLAAALCLVFSIPLGLALLLLHVLADGMDGPLARYSGSASHQGSFTDTAADQAVIVAIMIALVHLKAVDPAAAIVYAVVYTVVVGFAIVRNKLGIPYSWLVRPRFVIYGWLAIEFWVFPGSLNMLIWVCNLLLLAKALTGFYKIRRKI